MKKYLTLRNVIMASAVFVVLLFFFLSFAVNVNGFFNDGTDNYKVTLKGVIWGATQFGGVNLSTGAKLSSPVYLVFGISSTGLNLPVFFGLLFPLLGAIALVVCFFVIKNKKVFGYVALGIALVFVVGGILQFLAMPGLKSSMLREFLKTGFNEVEAKSFLNLALSTYGFKIGALSIMSGIFTILSGGALVVSQFIKDKELVK